MIKICLVEDLQYPASVRFYRTVGPLSLMAKQFPDDIEVSYMRQNEFMSDELNPMKFDLVLVERAITQMAYQIISHCKNQGTAVWVDFDDNILEIPHYNKARDFYNSQNVMQIVQACMANADIFSVSTKHLKDLYQSYTPNEILLVNNAWHDVKFQLMPKSAPQPNVKNIAWRGGGKHEGDLYPVRTTLKESIVDKKTNWTFYGFNPWFLGGDLNYNYTDFSNLYSYFKMFFTSNIDFLVVPLAKNNFNRSKSNCSWIEATIAGAVCVAPTYLDEFLKDGIVNYNTNAELKIALARIAKGKINHAKLLQTSREELQSKYKLTEINKLRLDRIKNL